MDVEVDVDHVEADVEGGGDGAWGDTGDAGLASLRIRTEAHDKSAWVARAQPKQRQRNGFLAIRFSFKIIFFILC